MSPDVVNNSDQWMLRAKGGQEYGPVPFDMLRAWAAQNRFTAGYEISHNRRDWRLVEAVPELGMDWFVEPGDGSRYGPFHPLALLDYIREGAVPPETRVVHKVNGGKAKAYQVLLEAFVDAIDQTAEVQGELIRQVQALQEHLEERDRWFSEENRQLQEEREKRQELEIAFHRRDDQAALTDKLQARLAQLEAELAQARKELETERGTRRETVLRLEEDLRAARADSDKRSRDAAQQVREQSQAEIESLKAEDAALRQELKQVRDALPKQRQDLEERLKKADIQASEAAAAASQAEAELAVLKGRQDRERQAHESEQAEQGTRAVVEARQETESLKQFLAQQREASEALSREMAVQRRENAALRDRLDAARVEVEEAARTDRELMQLRQTSATLKAQVAGLEKDRERIGLEHEAANRELETERGRILLLEARLADRAESKPLLAEPNGYRRRPPAENGTRPAWASGPVEDVPSSPQLPPPRKPASLAGLEAQAQAELKAWQEKKQAAPRNEPVPKSKSWFPWKKS